MEAVFGFLGKAPCRHVALGDASARFVAESIDPQVWKGLGTRAGGEVVGDF